MRRSQEITPNQTPTALETLKTNRNNVTTIKHFIMKKLFFFIAFTIVSVAGYCQLGQPKCGIYYSYDQNGQRVLREYDCKQAYDEGPEKVPFNPSLYPNPTNGPFTVALNELVASATMSVYGIGGEYIAAFEMEEGYEMSYDISGQVPGSYIVTVQVVRSDGTDAAQEFVLIKSE